MSFQPLYALSGLVVGMLIGITGVGGGSLMTPVLVLLFGIHPATAIGTDLLYAATTKTVGTAVHGVSGTVEWRVVGLLAAGSLPATLVTLHELVELGAPSDSVSRLISVVLGVALLLTSVSLIFRKQITTWAQTRTRPPSLQAAALLTVLTGLVLGVFVSISSVGAGAIGVTVLILLYPTLPTARIVGTDIAHAVPLTLVAGLGHWLIGSVDWHLFLSLIAGSLPGVILGSLVASWVPERLIRPILAGVLLVVGGKLLA
jgi:uncharacterized membrane protein YfcA